MFPLSLPDIYSRESFLFFLISLCSLSSKTPCLPGIRRVFFGAVWKLSWMPFLISFSGILGQEILLPRREDRSFEPIAAASSCPSPDHSLYYRPVIGIVTQPGDGASGKLRNATNAFKIPPLTSNSSDPVARGYVIILIYNEPWEGHLG